MNTFLGESALASENLFDTNSPAAVALEGDQRLRLSVRLCFRRLVHVSQCRDSRCDQPSCHQMKKLIVHVNLCAEGRQWGSRGLGCPVCKHFILVYIYHEKHCFESKCAVDDSLNVKMKLFLFQINPRFGQQVINRIALLLQKKSTEGTLDLSRTSRVFEGMRHASTSASSPPLTASQVKEVTFAPYFDVLRKDSASHFNRYSTHSNDKSTYQSMAITKIKDWRAMFPDLLRHDCVQKMIGTIFSMTDPVEDQGYGDIQKLVTLRPRLVLYAEQLERDIYSMARSREDYRRLISEKIHETQKEMEKRKKQAKLDFMGTFLDFILERGSSSRFSQRPLYEEAAYPENLRLYSAPGPRELREALMPALERLRREVPESLPFLQPVDPLVLEFRNYFDIFKEVKLNPMDLSAIDVKLDSGHYQDPWAFISDVWLMFDNAWLYNEKHSAVYGYSTRLSEIFEETIDPLMRRLGYCCGKKYVFKPQVLYCFGRVFCPIPRDADYYNYCNRAIYCVGCFAKIPGESVALQDNNAVPKNQFILCNHLDAEPFITCEKCDRKVHFFCCLRLDYIPTERFVCNECRDPED